MSFYSLTDCEVSRHVTKLRSYKIGTTLQNEVCSANYKVPILKNEPNIFRPIHRPLPSSYLQQCKKSNNISYSKEQSEQYNRLYARTRSPCRLKILNQPEDLMVPTNDLSPFKVTKRCMANKTIQELRENDKRYLQQCKAVSTEKLSYIPYTKKPLEKSNRRNTRTKSPCRLKAFNRPESVIVLYNNISHFEATKQCTVHKTVQKLSEKEKRYLHLQQCETVPTEKLSNISYTEKRSEQSNRFNTRTGLPCRPKILDQPEDLMVLRNDFPHVDGAKRVSVNKTFQELRENEKKTKMEMNAYLFNTKYRQSLFPANPQISKEVFKTSNKQNVAGHSTKILKLERELPEVNVPSLKQLRKSLNKTKVLVNPVSTVKQQNTQVEDKGCNNTAGKKTSLKPNLVKKSNKISNQKDVLPDSRNTSKSHNKFSAANLKIMNVQNKTNKQCTLKQKAKSYNTSVAIKTQLWKSVRKNSLRLSKFQSVLSDIIE